MSYGSLTLPEFAAHFATTVACLDTIVQRRWPQGWKCPHCEGQSHHRLCTRRVLPCANQNGRRQSSITVGTIFEHAKLPLPKVFLAISLITDKQGVSAMALSKHLGCHDDTAYRLPRRHRLSAPHVASRR
jgi:hypothetical protein